MFYNGQLGALGCVIAGFFQLLVPNVLCSKGNNDNVKKKKIKIKINLMKTYWFLGPHNS